MALQKVESLNRMVHLYRKRMEWLTSGSRQIFGVIQEHSITIVFDFGSLSKRQFDLCRNLLCLVLTEQVSRICRFNLIRAGADLSKWQQKTVQVSEHAIKCAIEWLWRREQIADAGKSGPFEALLQAVADKTVEAVYYFAVADVPASLKQLLLQKMSGSPCPIHTVSFNSTGPETLMFMKELSHQTGGRFHAFSEITENKNIRFITKDHKREDLSSETPLKGGTPPGAGVREDVFLIWQELEEARNTLIQIQAIAMQTSLHSATQVKNENPFRKSKSEDYVSSKQWLQKYSLKAQKLTLYDALADCAFRHSDGVVDINMKPEDESLQTDAEKMKTLVSAKYCDRFVHAHWKDGSVVHVYVSSEKCRWYEEKMKIALEQIEKRVTWLQHGSRELFGTVVEDQVCIMIDTSQSMKDKLSLVKEKLFQLMQEQLRHKDKFNFVKFDAHVASWKEKLADVNEENLENAWFWVKGLQVGSSTNTLQAIKIALADSNTEALYLLTDGRPDQPPETIMAQIQLQHPVPIHTISFNCDDTEANSFLYELSNKTGGRFHCYSSEWRDPEAPQAFVSEDIYLLMKEIEEGKQDLEKVQKLYAECLMLDWYHNGENGLKHKQASHNQTLKNTPRPQSAVERPSSPPRLHYKLHNISSSISLQRKKALHAEQTRTSILRTLCNDAKLCKNVTAKQMLLERNDLFLSNNSKSVVVIKELMQFEDKAPEKKTKRRPKDSLDMSSSRWLKTHGLVARRLTLMDSLAPTAVPHTAKYVPILDKHILSKVFDRVLPIAHVSGDKKLVTLINPLAVNLDVYKQKVERVIKSCERRLNAIIWRALSQEERDKFETLEPVAYNENKDTLLQALETLGWPISPEDVTLLEDEIETGTTYIQQATELQQQAKEEANKAIEPQVHSQEESIPDEHMEVKPKDKERKKVLDTLKGQRVIARSEFDGFYYPGTVKKCLTSKHVLVDFSQGDAQITPTPFIIPVGGAVPCPTLKVGDCVFCKTGTEGGNCCYIPAIVIATPRRREAADKFYSVLKYNNRQEHTSRKDLIKISQAKYAFTCHYIEEAHIVNYKTPKHQKEGKHLDSDTDKKDKNLVSGKQYGHVASHQYSSLPNETSHRKDFNSMPATVPHSSLPDTPGRKFSLIQNKYNEMAEQLYQYQIKQLEQQQNIQAILEELRSLKDNRDRCDALIDQKQVSEKIIQILQELEKLTSFGQNKTESSQEKATDPNTHPTPKAKTRINLIPGQAILFRDFRNGWYHRGSIAHSCGDDTYFVQSDRGEVTRIGREEIISDEEEARQAAIQEDDQVIGLHPLHPGSYCPGIVLKVSSISQLEIQYYDGVDALVPRNQVYPLTPELFEQDVAYIVECEERWVGQPVVARDDMTATFHLAEVQERVGNGGQYVIRWEDGGSVVQTASWIFGKYSQPRILKAGVHVLSLAHPSSLTFLPAVILDTNGAKLLVRFCNGERSRHVEPYLCFGLSEEQFNMAVQMYHQRISEIEARNGRSLSEGEESMSDSSAISITPSNSDKEDP
ncbi:von Willebrand factor A domain-containing protein 3B [Ambystoma mexicanum]|uniref:von Willebrand factor A domain-containing protein 3B n=1 Tax=Ambystoma mexicanum TaxID=8296 RepID=UPI0037E88F38